MRHFALLTLPDGVYACTANPDGSIPLSARDIARASPGDRDARGLRALVDQANAAHELAAALRRLSVALEWATTEERYDLEPARHAARLLLERIGP